MSQTRITLVSNEEDWEGVYINGRLATEGHTIRVEEVLKKLGYDVDEVTCDYDWLDSKGYLPDDLIGVVRADD